MNYRVYSHLFFVPVMVQQFRRKLYLELLQLLFTVMFSIAYTLNDSVKLNMEIIHSWLLWSSYITFYLSFSFILRNNSKRDPVIIMTLLHMLLISTSEDAFNIRHWTNVVSIVLVLLAGSVNYRSETYIYSKWQLLYITAGVVCALCTFYITHSYTIYIRHASAGLALLSSYVSDNSRTFHVNELYAR